MIQLADVTMSNSTGTHLAYCSYLGKPHWIVRQEITTKALNATGAANMAISEMMGKDAVNKREKEDLYQAFAEYSEVLTDEQRKVCDKYFGLSYVRTKGEMTNIVG